MSKDNIEDIYPLSPMQQGILFHTLYEPEAGVYFEQVSCTLRGNLNVAAFERVWQQLVDRHPALRAAFVWERREKPLQVVRKRVTLPWESLDWRTLPASEHSKRLEAFLSADRDRGFELNRAPLMRATLIRLADDAYQFVWSYHHLLLDGWSLSLLFQEAWALYEAYAQGREPALESRRPYREYVAWLEQQDMTQAEAYWRETLRGFRAATPLGVDRLAPDESIDYVERSVTLSIETTNALRAFAQRHQLTLNTLLQGAWAMLLHRYSGERDIIFGVVVSGRPPALPGSETMIGLFINTLPLRVRIPERTGLLPWLKAVQAQQVDMRQYEYSPLAQVQNWSEAPRGQPLFKSILAFENYPTDMAALPRDRAGRVEIHDFHFIERTNYPLSVEARPGPQLHLEINFDARDFDAFTIAGMLGHLQTLLENIPTHAESFPADVPMLTAAERRRLLVEWNDTAADFPRAQCFQELFEAQVERAPESIAAMCNGQKLTYRELNGRANRLARQLADRGVGPDTVVALLADRGLDLLTAILGVLKAGGAYLPLDPYHPAHRLFQMLDQSRTPIVLVADAFAPILDQAVADLAIERRPQVFRLDALFHAEAPEDNLPIRCASQNLAYVIYTSGSTGVPKGAMVEQVGMINHLYAKIRDLGLTESDRIAQTASQCFDISVWQFLAALALGGRVHIFDDDVARDPDQLLARVDAEGVTILETVPSLMRAMLDMIGLRGSARPALAALRWLIPTGEALPPDLCREWLRHYPHIPLLNAYGPTECSDDVTHYPIRRSPAAHIRHTPIGRPVINMQLYVLDAQLQLAPIGVTGELYVGGIGVGRGYLDRPDLTAERFIPTPPFFPPSETGRGEGRGRLYRTGDLARWLPDGDLEYLGRVDYQVKIRGHRIELGEIETVLRAHESVREAVVVAIDAVASGGPKRLAAYVALDRDAAEAPAAGDLRRYLSEQLPDYMLPAAVVFLDALPLTPNGKVDRKALPAPDATSIDRERVFVEPQTPIEKLLAEVWSQVLHVDRVSLHDNFFELGGDSILSIQVVSRAGQAGLRLTPKQVFQYPLLADLAAVASRMAALEDEPAVTGGDVPLTPIQRWFFEQEPADAHHWNQAVLLAARTGLNPAALDAAVAGIVQRHDALRLRFERNVSGWRQWNAAEESNRVFGCVDLSELAVDDQSRAVEAETACVQASLNLEVGPLTRVAYFEMSEGGRLLWVMHHLAVDSVSWRVLLEDLTTSYAQASRGEAIKLGVKTGSYRRWAEKVWEYGRSESVEGEASYWLRLVEGQVGRLPVDRAIDTALNVEGSASVVVRSLDSEATRALLQEAGRAYRMRVDEVLLAALVEVLAEWGGAERWLVAMEGHGREEELVGVSVARTVGWFTAEYPVVLERRRGVEFGEVLKGVKESIRGVPGGGLGYGLLRYGGGDVADRLRTSPQAEINFEYNGRLDHALSPSNELAAAPESARPIRSPRARRRYLLGVSANVSDEQLHVSWTYSPSAHTRETIERVADRYLEALRALIAHCLSPEAGGYTPSDFPLAKLDEQKIDVLLDQVEFEE